jgi:cell division septal protein FtsQ
MTSMWRAEENLKQNPYIGEAKIRRNINGTITINIIERIPAYVLRTQERYAYISNQGYILEIDGLPLELPVITGIKTEESGLEPGARLIREDLLKLEGLNIIMEAAKSYNLYNIINEIDISDHTEYTLSLETEGKIVHFGSSSRINQKMLWIVQIIEEEAGLSGEIFIRNLDFRRKSYV